jgi:hypothetical protein
MSHLTADIICRTVFSTSLDSQVAFDVFEDFTVFERSVAQVDIKHLIFKPAWSHAPQPPAVLEACRRIRSHLAALIDTHLAPGAAYDDIASAVIAARDSAHGQALLARGADRPARRVLPRRTRDHRQRADLAVLHLRRAPGGGCAHAREIDEVVGGAK